MHMHWIARRIAISILLPFLGLSLLVACGSQNSNKGEGSASAHASATAAAKCSATSITASSSALGTLKSMNGQTLVLTNQQKQNVTVTYSSSTHFMQQVYITASELQEGTEINVIVNGTNGVYTAVSVTVVPSGAGILKGTPGTNAPGAILNGTPIGGSTNNGGNGGSSNPCFKQFRGTPAASNSGTTNSQSISGTVGQVNGNILTVVDATGATYTVMLTSQTRIIRTQSATAAALKIGEPLLVTGTRKQSVIMASMVQILLNLPTSTITSS